MQVAKGRSSYSKNMFVEFEDRASGGARGVKNIMLRILHPSDHDR